MVNATADCRFIRQKIGASQIKNIYEKQVSYLYACKNGCKEAIRHPQRLTRIKTDNKTANSFMHASMRIKRSKTWDMRYHWLRENATQRLLDIYWDKGSNNNADYHTKHQAPAVHKVQRPRYILKGFSTSMLARSICSNINFLARLCSSCT